MNEKMIKWLLRYDKRQFLKLAPPFLAKWTLAVEDMDEDVEMYYLSVETRCDACGYSEADYGCQCEKSAC